MLHIFTIEYRGMAPTLPVDVCGAEYDELRVSTLLKNTPLKKLKRKLSNALESFLYNCATRFKGHIASAMSAGARHIKNCFRQSLAGARSTKNLRGRLRWRR